MQSILYLLGCQVQVVDLIFGAVDVDFKKALHPALGGRRVREVDVQEVLVILEGIDEWLNF